MWSKFSRNLILATSIAAATCAVHSSARAADDAFEGLLDEIERDGSKGQTPAQAPKATDTPKVVTPVTPEEPTDPELKTATLRLLGVWEGKVSQPNSADETSYTIEIEFYLGPKGLVFDSWYPELRCGGAGGLTRQLKNGASFNETITEGRERCVDGPFMVTYLKGKQLYWDWGSNQATAKLSKKIGG